MVKIEVEKMVCFFQVEKMGSPVPDIIDNGDLSGVVGDIVITEVSVEVTGVVTVVVGLVINVVCFV